MGPARHHDGVSQLLPGPGRDRRGKLKAAARLISVGRIAADPATTAEIDRLREELEFFGASPEQIDQVVSQVGPAAAPETFYVQGCNVSAVQLFRGLRTQWNTQIVAGLAGGGLVHIGLRYEVIDQVRRGLGIVERDGDLIRLQIMEAEALLAFNEGRR